MRNLIAPLQRRIEALLSRSRDRKPEGIDMDHLAYLNWLDLWEPIFRAKGFHHLADSVAEMRKREASR